MNNKDTNSYYNVLELSKNATDVEIKKKYRELAVKYHPDKVSVDKKEEATQKFKEISEAYTIISDPEKRKLYDQFGKDGLNGMAGMSDTHGFNPHDIFNNIFGGMGGMGGMPFNQQKPQVKPIELIINVTLENLFTGLVINKSYERDNICIKCDATGFIDKKPHNCPKCKGNKKITQRMQLGPGIIQQISVDCNDCNGTGINKNADGKCKHCLFGIIKETNTIKITIKPGMVHRQYIEILNEGHTLPNGTKGPVVAVINQEEHKIYKRYSRFANNLQIMLEISLADALCGFTKELKHVSNKTIYIKSNDIIKDNSIKIIKKEGMPSQHTSSIGDLIIKFIISYPDNITADNKKKLYKLLTDKDIKLENNSQEYHSLVDIDDYNGYNEADDDENNTDNAESAQCAQQ